MDGHCGATTARRNTAAGRAGCSDRTGHSRWKLKLNSVFDCDQRRVHSDTTERGSCCDTHHDGISHDVLSAMMVVVEECFESNNQLTKLTSLTHYIHHVSAVLLSGFSIAFQHQLAHSLTVGVTCFSGMMHFESKSFEGTLLNLNLEAP